MLETSRLKWEADLAPGHRWQDGSLYIGGVGVAQLAEEHGTPQLILDAGILDTAIALFAHVIREHDIDVAYAGKALLLRGLARRLINTPLSLDVCSMGELLTAQRAGFPAHRLHLHGCAKTPQELQAACDGAVGRIIVDNLEELSSLVSMANSNRVGVLLRINTGIEAHTHAFVRTAGEATKFGIGPSQLDAAAALLRQNERLEFRGFHSHIGSQIYERGAFSANAREVLQCSAAFAAMGFPSSEVIYGGGFAVESGPDDDPAPDIREIVAGLAKLTPRGLRFGIEPGRAVIARAGTSLYRVAARKQQGSRAFLIVDGGIADNPRPALYDAYHHGVLASRQSDAPRETMTVCGRSCENDRLTEASLPADVKPGDLLAVCTAGAYTYSMASNYNRFARPAVTLVDNGAVALLARRESLDEVLRLDVDS